MIAESDTFRKLHSINCKISAALRSCVGRALGVENADSSDFDGYSFINGWRKSMKRTTRIVGERPRSPWECNLVGVPMDALVFTGFVFSFAGTAGDSIHDQLDQTDRADHDRGALR
jgi:hypothetical protein